MFNDQEGLCAICRRQIGFTRETHVDHCHLTGKVRGLLCSGCNRALGGAEDNVETLRRMIAYLVGVA